MSIDCGLLSMAQQFSGLPMKSLIGAPLQAAADANARMATSQTKFILDTGFRHKGSKASSGGQAGSQTAGQANALNDEEYEPVMISFELKRNIIDKEGKPAASSPAKTTFDVPLLTIIPINSLAVDEVKVHFEMEVKSSYSHDKETSAEAETKAEYGFSGGVNIGPWFSAEVHGSVSASTKASASDKEHYEKSNQAKYEVDVHAGQLPLPKGVTTIIDAFTRSVDPVMIK